MGNNNSSSSSTRRSSVTRELEKFTTPTGEQRLTILYPSCPWELKTAKRMILDRKIAPRFPGREAKESCFTQECPICFMYYPGNLNVSTCCKKPICSECFLQMKPPKKAICCPFCNRDTFGIKYTAPAVIELSSIYSERSPAAPVSKPVAIPVANREERSLSHHYASVEDRAKLRDDLRSQLNIAVGPITTPPPTSAVAIEDALMYASPADANRLEELMILEAIRRSMYDVTLGAKNTTGEASQGADRGANDDDEEEEEASEDAVSEYEYSESNSPVTPSQIQLSESREHSPSRVRRSSNPFDEDFSAAGGSGDRPVPLSSSSEPRNPDWNPFNG